MGRAQSIESGAVRSIGQKKLRNKDPHQKKEKRQTFPSQVSFLFFCFSFLCFSIASNALRSTESRAEGLVFRHLHQPQQLPLSLTVHYVPALHIPFFLFRFFFLFFFFPYNPHVYKQDTHTHRGKKEGKEEQLTQVSRLSYALPPLSAQLPAPPLPALQPKSITRTESRKETNEEARKQKKNCIHIQRD